MEQFFLYLNLCILIYYFSILLWYSAYLFLSVPVLIRNRNEIVFGNIDFLMQRSSIPVAISMPVYNEEKRAFNAIYSILNSNYKNVHAIIVNDGSTDKTLEMLIDEFDLKPLPINVDEVLSAAKIKTYYQSNKFPNLHIIDKEHGKNGNGADSHNTALNVTTAPLMVTFDADTIVEPDAITKILFYFFSKQHCIAVGGAIYVLNGNKLQNGRLESREISSNFLPAIQWLEYLRSFTFGRTALNSLGGALCYPGAFTLFETKALKDLGGFDSTNFSYDAEITIKLHQVMRDNNYPTNVKYCADAIAWTTVPSTLKSYWNQRNRWQRGMLLSVYLHKSMLFNPRYGIVGIFTFPGYIAYEIFGPVVECIAYISSVCCLYLGYVTFNEISKAVIFACVSLTILSVLSLFFNTLISDMKAGRRWLQVIGLTILENLGFRQFRAICCTYSTLQYFFNRLRGKRL